MFNRSTQLRIRQFRRHRGVTSLIAMMYLVLISSLVLGFYAMTTTSAQLSSNDERIARAYLAADSGMDFMRRQLAKVRVPPHTAPEMSIEFYYPDMGARLNGTGNLNGGSISRSGNTISIPANGAIKLDAAGNSRFRATITDWAGEIVVKVEGFYGTTAVTRTITMDFTRQTRSSSVFDYAIASKGQIVMKKGTVTSSTGVDPSIAAMFSAKPDGTALIVEGGEIGGDLTLMETAAVSVTGGSVGGSSVTSTILSDHVHTTDTSPEFPAFDPTVYKPYASNSWVDDKKTQQNILIRAGTNPTFNANDTVQGIMYVESPNQVTFNGNFKLQGFIIMEPGASTNDQLNFSGNLTMSPVPNDPIFNSVRAVSGVAIMAPNAKMSMTGSSGGNIKGNVIVKEFNFKGAADLLFDLGTLMAMSEEDGSVVFDGSKSIRFTATGSNNIPSQGITYSQFYVAKPSTYQEPLP
jgi:hypothetical protein